ncbi:hypothetical protein JKF63_02207 [Porcisia hertigi]|uniref:Uncharacterized protein n=1 Tax=Porcisia hertigi TaxID=2761500 RepID=A0A836I7S0_9TRYP|nr:hypothetical protein JKF63_02207 [Porcisia hertigi]
MTEFKKLTALADTLAQDVLTLKACCTSGSQCSFNGTTADGDALGTLVDGPDSLHLLSTRIRETIVDAVPRVRKIVLKARETDPNRQMYNEAMCAKIEALFLAFCKCFQLLAPECFDTLTEGETPLSDNGTACHALDNLLSAEFDPNVLLADSPSLQVADEIYNHYILQRAKAEAWHSRVAQGLADAIAFESQNRSLVLAEEKVSRVAALEEKRADKVRVTKIMEERAQLKWQSELQRRGLEWSRLKTAATAISDIDAIPSFLARNIIDKALRVAVADHVLQLVKALLSTPEDVNIRRLRNNNEHLISDYGHPCLSACDPRTGERCICQAVVSTAEVLWCRIGYTIRYTKVPSRSLNLARSEVRADSQLLPCGQSLPAHTYEPMGFEDYSERFFELEEPDAMVRADEWMEWYIMMKHMELVLSNILSSSYR